jgi:hypothetical protein
MKKSRKKDFLVLGNSGKVYMRPDVTDRGLGSVKCEGCKEEKPFEQMRWNELQRVNLCHECRSIIQ